MARFIGIDPGAKGSLCLLDTITKEILFQHTPGKVSVAQAYNWIGEQSFVGDIQFIGIEDVHSVAKSSAKSNFSFGFNVGQARAIADLTAFGVDLVQPKEWQKACGIQFKAGLKPAERKAIVGARAIQLYPSAPLHGPQGGLLDGRADALMIAHYLSIKYGGNP